ncbi:carbohydrate-binding family 9-like protein [Mucilaginibacter xinganensis]|uniref:Carbohydrate-binding family 9 n=1 Tax=Mucilaginibacter xinganensis TaxID=1234841 RepID=A0A223NW63_9SPHI|nr:carbohydrate-binding family 9-like protein [Mucilaginibacter xinganensis]ASU34115.1 Carbohydrate-binding family 9 [Mucilaginibacter xinganensis]
MKNIYCGILNQGIPVTGIENVSALFDLQDREYIHQLPWDFKGQKPEVSFAIAHDKNGIYLKYWVLERYFRAFYKNINDPVYKDSCVEAFLSFNNDAGYYNLEFNGAGVVLGGYGTDKFNRVEIPRVILSRIKTFSKVNPQDLVSMLHRWELTIFIPFEVFVNHQLTGLSGLACRANFYKCGDDLPEPHFLTWAPVEHPYPEFHLPGFFGTILFL